MRVVFTTSILGLEGRYLIDPIEEQRNQAHARQTIKDLQVQVAQLSTPIHVHLTSHAPITVVYGTNTQNMQLIFHQAQQK